MNRRLTSAPPGQPVLSRAVRPRSRTARAWRYPATALALAALAALCVAGCGSTAAGPGHLGMGHAGPAHPTGSSAASGGAGRSSTQTSGSSQAGPANQGATAPASRGSLLCAHRDAVTRLTVTRPPMAPHRPVMPFPFPGRLATKSAVSARAVAAAVCALPRLPRLMRCPASLLTAVYLLTFDIAGRALPPVIVNATGCEPVTGAGPVRTANNAPAFWRALGAAIGFRLPGPPLSGGLRPVGHQCQSRTAGRGLLNGCPGLPHPVTPPTPRAPAS